MIHERFAFIMTSCHPSHKCPLERAGATIHLAQNQATSVPGRRGTTIRCMAGMVWITREGDWRDYLLPQGVSFVAAGAGKIVINGQMPHNRVVVGHTALERDNARAHRALRYGTAFFSRIEIQARAARSAHLAVLLDSLRRALVHAWRGAQRAIAQRIKTQSSRTAC